MPGRLRSGSLLTTSAAGGGTARPFMIPGDSWERPEMAVVTVTMAVAMTVGMARGGLAGPCARFWLVRVGGTSAAGRGGGHSRGPMPRGFQPFRFCRAGGYRPQPFLSAPAISERMQTPLGAGSGGAGPRLAMGNHSFRPRSAGRITTWRFAVRESILRGAAMSVWRPGVAGFLGRCGGTPPTTLASRWFLRLFPWNRHFWRRLPRDLGQAPLHDLVRPAVRGAGVKIQGAVDRLLLQEAGGQQPCLGRERK